MNTPKIVSVIVIAALLAALGGYFVGRHGDMSSGVNSSMANARSTASAQRKVLYWKAPMDANYRSDKPGKSPMGMDLVPVYADENSNDHADVKINPDVVNNLGVRTTEVRQGSLSDRIEAVGYVGYDENSISSINTRADGWIEKLAVNSAGDAVQRGQLLYELFSPKLATAEREYLTAMGSGSRSLIDASRMRMQSLGFSAGQIHTLTRTKKVSARVARRADRSGVVTSLNVREGAYVTPATQVMKLADLGTVWVLVEVGGSQAGLLQVGQQATATFDAFPGRHWQGTVDYIYPDLNAVTRTAKLRLRFGNPDRHLQPNMYAHVRIAAAPQTDAVYIPNQALIRTGHSQRVVVALGQGRFDVCPVEAGITSGDQVEILKGLLAGQRVVTSAQFMIDSEANIDAAALRLGGGQAGCHQSAAADTPATAGMHDMDMSDGATPAAPANSGSAGAAPSATEMEGMPMAGGKHPAAPPATPAEDSSNRRQQP